MSSGGAEVGLATLRARSVDRTLLIIEGALRMAERLPTETSKLLAAVHREASVMRPGKQAVWTIR